MKRLLWCLPFSLPLLKLQAGGPIWASEMKMGMNSGWGVGGWLGLGEGRRSTCKRKEEGYFYHSVGEVGVGGVLGRARGP